MNRESVLESGIDIKGRIENQFCNPESILKEELGIGFEIGNQYQRKN